MGLSIVKLLALCTLSHPHRLFEIAPDLKYLFPFKDQDLTDDNALLKQHSMQVMESIDMCLGMTDDPEELQETLVQLGIVHNMNDVQVESFAVSTFHCSITVLTLYSNIKA